MYKGSDAGQVVRACGRRGHTSGTAVPALWAAPLSQQPLPTPAPRAPFVRNSTLPLHERKRGAGDDAKLLPGCERALAVDVEVE